VHLGPPALQQRERGLPGDRAAFNAEIRAANLQLGEIRTHSATAQRQLEALQRQLGLDLPARPAAASALPVVPELPVAAATIPPAPTAPEAERFIALHRKDFSTRAAAERWFDRELQKLSVLASPATARGLFEESPLALERDRADFGVVLEKALVTPSWQTAPRSVGVSIVQARREIAEARATAAALAQRLATHQEGRSLWRRLLGPDPERLRLERERDSALARMELHRATLTRIEAHWEQAQPDWESAAEEKNADRRDEQRHAAERLELLRPAVLAELQRREEEPLRRQREAAEQAAYIRQSLDRGITAEVLWLDLLLEKDYSRQQQEELDALIRNIQAERKRQEARAAKPRVRQFGVDWIGFN
jgi:hypothetical protein